MWMRFFSFLCFFFFLNVSLEAEEPEEITEQRHISGYLAALGDDRIDFIDLVIRNGVYLKFPFKNSKVKAGVSLHIHRMVSSVDPEHNILGLEAISLLGDSAKSFFENIRASLESGDERVVSTAIQAIGNLLPVSGSLVSELPRFLDDRSPLIRISALRVMAQIGHLAEPFMLKIMDRLTDLDIWVSGAAVDAIVELKDIAMPHMVRIVPLLGHESLWVRTAAAEAIGRMKDLSESDIGLIREYLKSSHKGTVVAAILSLGQIPSFLRENTSLLIPFLKDKDLWVRQATVKALGNCGKDLRRYAPSLMELLCENHIWVQHAVIKSLENLGSHALPYCDAIIPFLSHQDEALRLSAVAALENIWQNEPERKIRHFSSLVEDPSPFIREKIMKTMMGLHGKTAKESHFMVRALKDPSVIVRRSALQYLSGHPYLFPACEPLLHSLLDDPEIDIRLCAAEILSPKINLSGRSYLKIILLLSEKKNASLKDIIISLERLCRISSRDPWRLITSIIFAVHIYPSIRQELKFFLLMMSGADPSILPTLTYLGILNALSADPLAEEMGVKSVLEGMRQIGRNSQFLEDLKWAIEEKTLQIISTVQWDEKDLAFLKSEVCHYESGAVQEAFLRKIDELNHPGWFEYLFGAILGHFLLWGLLIILYPRFSIICGFAFWSPFWRSVMGLGYVEILLLYIPFLRRRMLIPFRRYLVSGISLDEIRDARPLYVSFEKEKESESSKIRDIRFNVDARVCLKIRDMDKIRSPVLVIGPQGSGKTMLLKMLLSRKRVPAVYLPARLCEGGVFTAVTGKLKGALTDLGFLKKIIQRGGLDIYIDGLEDVDPYTDLSIKSFLIRYPAIKAVLTTRPKEREIPSCFKIYYLRIRSCLGNSKVRN